MNDFDKYTSDQFPFRVNFIKIKNTYNYGIGQREFRNIYICNNKLLEKFEFNKDAGMYVCKAGHMAIRKAQNGKKGIAKNRKDTYYFNVFT